MNIAGPFDFGPVLQTACAQDSDDATDMETTDDGPEGSMHRRDTSTLLDIDLTDPQPQSADIDATFTPIPRSPSLSLDLSSHDDHIASASEGITEPTPSKNRKSHDRRKRRRAEEADGRGHEPRPRTKAKILALTTPVPTALVTKDLRVACGAYEAFRKEIIRGLKVVVTPAKGLSLGIQYVRIDPTSTK